MSVPRPVAVLAAGALALLLLLAATAGVEAWQARRVGPESGRQAQAAAVAEVRAALAGVFGEMDRQAERAASSPAVVAALVAGDSADAGALAAVGALGLPRQTSVEVVAPDGALVAWAGFSFPLAPGPPPRGGASEAVRDDAGRRALVLWEPVRAGAELLVADISPARRADAEARGARWLPVAEAMVAPVDVLCPCALGGVLDHESVPALQAPIVAGAANNQLAGDEVAALLGEHGVLWAPDFVANAGGIINISVELEADGYDPARARKLVDGIGDVMRAVLQDAASAGTTTLAAAMALARRRVAEA